MDSSKAPLREREERHRSARSISTDSEAERRRRRRRKERETAERDTERSGRSDDRREKYDDRDRKCRRSRSPERESSRDKYADRERRRRASRSPAHESSRRRLEGRDSKYKSTREPSPGQWSSKEKGSRPRKDDSTTQVGHKSNGPLPSQAVSFQSNDSSGALVLAEEVEKQKPSLAPTGLLAAASNSVAQVDGSSIVLKYHEPAEARKPPAKDDWKLFVFKGSEIVETITLGVRSCWLIGRELSVTDMAAEHPSISKQHAVIQFRHIVKKNEFGDKLGKVKPYLIDLESANGTTLNKEQIPASRYLELRDKDLIQFGHSTREYVLMLSPRT